MGIRVISVLASALCEVHSRAWPELDEPVAGQNSIGGQDHPLVGSKFPRQLAATREAIARREHPQVGGGHDPLAESRYDVCPAPDGHALFLRKLMLHRLAFFSADAYYPSTAVRHLTADVMP